MGQEGEEDVGAENDEGEGEGEDADAGTGRGTATGARSGAHEGREQQTSSAREGGPPQSSLPRKVQRLHILPSLPVPVRSICVPTYGHDIRLRTDTGNERSRGERMRAAAAAGEEATADAVAKTPAAAKRRRESRGEMMAMLATGVQKRRRLKGMGEVKPPDAE